MTKLNSKNLITPRSMQILHCLITIAIFGAFTSRLLVPKDLVLVWLCIGAIFLFNSTRKLTIQADWIVYPCLITLIVYLSTVTSAHPEIATRHALIYRDLALIAASLYLTVRESLVRYAEQIMVGMVIAFLLFAPYTLWEYLVAVPELQKPTKYISPDLSFYAHIRHFSYHAFIASTLATIILICSPKKEAWQYLLCAACVLALLLSTGRAAIGSYAAFLMLIGGRALPIKRLVLFGVISILVLMLILFLLWLSPAQQVADSLISRTLSSSGLDGVLSGRIGYWVYSLNELQQSPLMGLGPDIFRTLHDRPSGTAQPHSSLVQLALEFGWLGGSVLILCFAKLLSKVLDFRSISWSKNPLPYCLTCFVVAYFIYSLVDGLFYYSLPMMHLALVLATLAVFSQTNTHE